MEQLAKNKNLKCANKISPLVTFSVIAPYSGLVVLDPLFRPETHEY